MRCNSARAVLCTSVVLVVLAASTAQAATVGYWRFDENTPGNPVSFAAGAILDEGDTGANDGTAYGGDPFNDPDVNVYSRYVDGPTAGDSALRMTLQDWPDQSSYTDVEEDMIQIPSGGTFNIDLGSGTVYTIEAIIRVPDPMDIMDSDLYHGLREGFDAFPQWYDYTDDSIMSKPIPQPSGVSGWNLRLRDSGHLAFGVYDGTNSAEPVSTQVLTGGVWHHVAAKIITSANPANRKVEYWIDGVKDSEGSLSAVSGVIGGNNGQPVHIGSAKDGYGDYWGSQFIGDIDSVRFSTGAVTLLPVPTQTVPTLNLGHTGMTDPNTEAHLKLVDGSDTGDPSSTGTAIAGVGGNPDSWRLQEVGHDDYMSNSYAYYRGLLAPEQLQDPNGWTLTATMKLGTSNKPWNQCMGVEDGTSAWVMSFMDSTFTQVGGDQGAGIYKSGAYHFAANVFDTSYFTGVTKMGTTNPTDGFHTYKMQYDPATDSVTFYVDGSAVGTQTRAEAWNRDADAFTSECRFFFGDSYPLYFKRNYYPGDTASDAYWSNVTLEVAKDPQYRPYDINEDGFVGADDLDVVRAHWGESGPGGKAIGDINLDEFVGADDLDQLRAHWGEVCPPVPGLVPEPSTFVLLSIGALILFVRRRRY